MKPAIGVLVGFALLVVVATAASLLVKAQGSASPELEELRPLDLPDALSSAADVRWQEDGSLLFGLRRDGIYSWVPGAQGTEAVATLAGSTHWRAARYGDYSRLGGGAVGALVFAGDLFGVFRQSSDGRVKTLKANLEIVGDLHHRDGLTVAVGLARQPRPSPGPDDVWEPYIAWLIDAEGGVRGLLPTRDDGAAMDVCYPAELSISRFVADGLVLVIPGAEPGAYLYAADGALREVLDLETFSTSRPDCGPEQKPLLREQAFRTEWLNRHRFIDEVAANDEGDVFFFVRHAADSEPMSEARQGDSPKVARAPATSQGAGGTAVVRGVATGAGDSGTGGEPRVVAFGLDGLGDAELKELLEGASPDGTLIITGEQAARLLAAANARNDVRSDTGAASPPSAPRATICWDIVHARTDDLQSVSSAPCAVTSDRADARLRVDLAGDRAVFLVRGATRLASGNQEEPVQVFEARLRAGS